MINESQIVHAPDGCKYEFGPDPPFPLLPPSEATVPSRLAWGTHFLPVLCNQTQDFMTFIFGLSVCPFLAGTSADMGTGAEVHWARGHEGDRLNNKQMSDPKS